MTNDKEERGKIISIEYDCEMQGHSFSWRTITHDGITHPVGEQICDYCNKTCRDIINENINRYKESFKSELRIKDDEIERLRKDNERFQEVYYRLMTQLTNEIEGTTK